ncbi:hypothetical protein GCM10020220_089780 [Nonomuraea rubra]
MPRKTFSSTVSVGASGTCCMIVATPAFLAAPGVRQATCSPFHRTWPEVGSCAPAITLIIVDLPAPFAPTRPCTLPGCTVRRASLSATVPLGNSLPMPVRDSSGVTIAACNR